MLSKEEFIQFVFGDSAVSIPEELAQTNRVNLMTQKTQNRIDAMVSIGAKFNADVMKLNKKYINIAAANISNARAEQAASSGKYYRALTMHLHAACKYPHWKAFRAVGSDFKNMICQ